MPQKGLLLPSAEDLTAPRTFTCSLGDLKLLPLRLEIASEDLELLLEDLNLLSEDLFAQHTGRNVELLYRFLRFC